MFNSFINWLKSLFCKEKEPLPNPIHDIPEEEETEEVLTKRQQRLVNLWNTMEQGFLKGQAKSTITWYLNKVKAGEDRYKLVEKATGVPWEVVACTHGLEASFNWKKNLMNGQDWTRRTTWVPKGHGPWISWHDAAVAAFELKRKEGKLPKSWSIGETLEFMLRFNGLGYEYKGLVSPYLWSFTNHYVNQGGGKYVSDGKFSRSAISKQVGAAVILKELNY